MIQLINQIGYFGPYGPNGPESECGIRLHAPVLVFYCDNTSRCKAIGLAE